MDVFRRINELQIICMAAVPTDVSICKTHKEGLLNLSALPNLLSFTALKMYYSCMFHRKGKASAPLIPMTVTEGRLCGKLIVSLCGGMLSWLRYVHVTGSSLTVKYSFYAIGT